jgi:hypothetical protein
MPWDGKTEGVIKMEDMGKEINYRLEMIKAEIKQTLPTLEGMQKLMFLNAQLAIIYDIGLIKADKRICATIKKYLETQTQIEDDIAECEQRLYKNMDTIIDNIMKEL